MPKTNALEEIKLIEMYNASTVSTDPTEYMEGWDTWDIFGRHDSAKENLVLRCVIFAFGLEMVTNELFV